VSIHVVFTVRKTFVSKSRETRWKAMRFQTTVYLSLRAHARIHESIIILITIACCESRVSNLVFRRTITYSVTNTLRVITWFVYTPLLCTESCARARVVRNVWEKRTTFISRVRFKYKCIRLTGAGRILDADCVSVREVFGGFLTWNVFGPRSIIFDRKTLSFLCFACNMFALRFRVRVIVETITSGTLPW